MLQRPMSGGALGGSLPQQPQQFSMGETPRPSSAKGSTVTACQPPASGASAGSVRYTWDPKQLPLPQDWLSAAISGMPVPQPSSPLESSPWTPPKAFADTVTPQKPPEAPKAAESDDTTPPKDLNVNQPPRRGHMRLVPTPQNAHAQGPLRSSQAKIHQRKDSFLPPKTSTTTSEAVSFVQQAEEVDVKVDTKLFDPVTLLESLRRKQRELSTVSVAVAPVAQEAAAPPVESEKAKPVAREPLRELGVTSPRCSKDSALCSLEELPNSLRHALMFVRNIPQWPHTDPKTCRPLLPPLRSDAPSRPTLVLDLDETLVHCSRSSSSRSGPPPANPDLIVEFDDQPSRGAVAFRPHVHHFLEEVSKSFEVAVFTASQMSYADKVINALDPSGTLIEHRLYRQHCTEMRGAYFKELSLMGRPLQQCILVDNSPISVACNADNSVLIRSWYGDQNDQELLDLLAVFKKMQLYAGGDCGRFLANRYGLREFFEALRESVGHKVH